MLGIRKRRPLSLDLGGASGPWPAGGTEAAAAPPVQPVKPELLRPGKIEVFVDPSLLNLVEKTAEGSGAKPAQAPADPPPPKPAVGAPPNQIRFRPLSTTNLRIPVPDEPQKEKTPPRTGDWGAPVRPAAPPAAQPSGTPPQAAAPVTEPPRHAPGRFVPPKVTEPPVARKPAEPAPPAPKPVETQPLVEAPASYEFVLGKRQIASLLFVATALMALTSSVAYLVGKNTGRKSIVVATPVAVRAVEVAPAAPAPTQVPAPVEPKVAPPVPAEPVFANPQKGKAYLQVTAVEKGMAQVIAQGFRARGLDTIAAPGPSAKVFRVLIGPLPDQAAFLRAKDAVDDLGLSNSARRFVE